LRGVSACPNLVSLRLLHDPSALLYRPEPEQELGAPQDEEVPVDNTWREEVEAPKLTAPPLRALPPPRRVLTSDLESCRAACQRGISFDNKIEEYRNKDYHLGSQQTGTTHPCKHLRSRLTLEPDAKYSDGRQHSDCRW